MKTTKLCLKCHEIITFCECKPPITDKDEYNKYLESIVDTNNRTNKMSVEKFIEHRYSIQFGDKWDRVAKLFDYYDMTDFAEAYIDYLNE